MNKLFRLFPLALVVFIVIFSINRAPERPSNVQIPNVSSKLKLANSYGNGSLDNLQIGDDGLVYTLGSKGLMRFDRDMKNGVVLIDEAATDISLKKDGLVIRGNLLAVVLINGLTLFDTERNKIIWSEKNYKAEHIAISPSGNHIFSSKLTKEGDKVDWSGVIVSKTGDSYSSRTLEKINADNSFNDWIDVKVEEDAIFILKREGSVEKFNFEGQILNTYTKPQNINSLAVSTGVFYEDGIIFKDKANLILWKFEELLTMQHELERGEWVEAYGLLTIEEDMLCIGSSFGGKFVKHIKIASNVFKELEVWQCGGSLNFQSRFDSKNIYLFNNYGQVFTSEIGRELVQSVTPFNDSVKSLYFHKNDLYINFGADWAKKVDIQSNNGYLENSWCATHLQAKRCVYGDDSLDTNGTLIGRFSQLPKNVAELYIVDSSGKDKSKRWLIDTTDLDASNISWNSDLSEFAILNKSLNQLNIFDLLTKNIIKLPISLEPSTVRTISSGGPYILVSGSHTSELINKVDKKSIAIDTCYSNQGFISDDGKFIAMGCLDSKINIYSSTSKGLISSTLFTFTGDEGITSMKFTTNNDYLAVGTTNGFVYTYRFSP